VSLQIKNIFDDNSNEWVVSLIGDVDISSSNFLKDELNRILDEKEVSVNLECESLSYIDSTGLGILISVLRRVKGCNNTMSFTNAQSNITKLLKITGLDKIFIIK
jgi:anti-sigma B factor antagonist